MGCKSILSMSLSMTVSVSTSDCYTFPTSVTGDVLCVEDPRSPGEQRHPDGWWTERTELCKLGQLCALPQTYVTHINLLLKFLNAIRLFFHNLSPNKWNWKKKHELFSDPCVYNFIFVREKYIIAFWRIQSTWNLGLTNVSTHYEKQGMWN